MSQPKGYVDTHYLQVAAELFAPIKQRSYEQMHVQRGQTVLDIGCGPGLDTTALAQLVGPTGFVLGIDYDAEMVAEANRRAVRAGMAAFVHHEKGDATTLALASERFDACRSERLFMHLQHPAQALAEMTRVTRPGGWIVVLDVDWGTASLDTPEVDIERQLARVRAECMLHNGYVGRQLYRLFKERGLVEISYELFPIAATEYALARFLGRFDEVEQEALAASIVTPDELQRWHAGLKQADEAGVFFATTTLMMVAGRKPPSSGAA